MNSVSINSVGKVSSDLSYSGVRRPFSVHPVQSFEELVSAFDVVYQQYFKHGYIDGRRSELHFSLNDLLPSTVTLVAKLQDIVVGTAATVFGTIWKLPSASLYSAEVRMLDKPGCSVAEGIKFAFLDSAGAEIPNIAREFLRWKYHWWHHMGVDSVLMVVHPRHRAFWRRYFLANVIGSERGCPRVSGNPGILLCLEVSKTFAGSTRKTIAYQELVAWPVAKEEFISPYQLDTEEIAIFLCLEPALIRASNSKTLGALVFKYPRLRGALNKLEPDGDPDGHTNGAFYMVGFRIKEQLEKILFALKRFFQKHDVTPQYCFDSRVGDRVFGDPIRVTEQLVSEWMNVTTHVARRSTIHMTITQSRQGKLYCRYRSSRYRSNDGTTLQTVKEHLLSPVTSVPRYTTTRPGRHLTRISSTNENDRLGLVSFPSYIERRMLQLFMLRHGWSARASKDGYSVLDWITRDTCDLLLLDGRLPDIECLELVRAVRQIESTRGLRKMKIVTVFSALTDTLPALASQSGVDLLLTKPLAKMNLLEKLLVPERYERPPATHFYSPRHNTVSARRIQNDEVISGAQDVRDRV